jgi:hypothetical protein
MNEEATKSAVAAPAAGRGRSAIIGDEGVGKALSEKRRFCQTNPSWATDQSSPQWSSSPPLREGSLKEPVGMSDMKSNARALRSKLGL